MAVKKPKLNYMQKHVIARVFRMEVARISLLTSNEKVDVFHKTYLDGQLTLVMQVAIEIGIGDFLTTEY